MANAVTSLDGDLAVLEVGTSGIEVTLNSDREYTVAHDGVNASEAATAEAVFIGHDDAPTADHTSEDDHANLIAGRKLVVGPGQAKMYLITATATVIVTVAPGPKLRGAY